MQPADSVLAECHIVAGADGIRIGKSQRLPDQKRLLVREKRIRETAHGRRKRADLHVAGRQVALELPVVRVGVSQALPDRARLLVRVPRFVPLAERNRHVADPLAGGPTSMDGPQALGRVVAMLLEVLHGEGIEQAHCSASSAPRDTR